METMDLHLAQVTFGSMRYHPVLGRTGADINGEASSDNSGISVSMNSAGDRVAIGAHENDGTSSNAGHASTPTTVLPGRNSVATSMGRQEVTTLVDLYP